MKQIYNIWILILFLTIISCQDQELFDVDKYVGNTSQNGVITRSNGLTPNSSGYFVASRRVPLVGEGRIVNDLSPALISVINTDQGIGNIVDTNINNAASFGGVAGIELLGNQIASVRDVNLVYAGGQEAGFIYNMENDALLTLDVLKGFVVSTYLDGVLQETKGGDLSAKVLDLNVLTFAGGSAQKAVSISTQISKPFDEIKLGLVGISAEVAKSLKLYYAFVGENPILPCVSGSTDYPDSKLGKVSTLLGIPTLTNTANLVDADIENSMPIGAGLSVGVYYATVNLNKEVPVGYEIGFYTSAFDLLNLSLGGGFKISTYDSTGAEVESYSVNSLLGLSLIKGSTASLMSMVTTKPCTQVRITYSAVLGLNLGATKVYYAYVREPATVDISSYYSLSNAKTALSYYQFHTPKEGNVSFSLVSQPSGASAIIAGNNITNMNLPGDYVVDYTYTKDGESFTRRITVTKLDNSIADDCNNTITRPTYPDVNLYSPQGGGSLITLENMASAVNMIDANPNNYVDYVSLVSIAANTSIVAVNAGSKINPLKEKIRTGFTFQTANNLLGINALKFFVIKLYDGNNKVFESVANNNSSVGVGLIGSNGDKVRVSVSTDVTFDKIELWTAGVLNLSLNSFRLYNAFWEPTSTCISSIGNEACMEIISQSSHGAEISYERTGTGGVAGVGSSFNELGRIIDADKNSYATLTFTNVINKATLGVKFNELPAGQAVGFIIQTPEGIADVELIGGTRLILYNKGTEVASTGSGGILGLDLISYAGLTYVETTASVPFDEMVIEFGGVASLLNWVRVYGAFTRADSDGDGIPDCAEPEIEPEILTGRINTPHVCEGDPIEIEVTAGGIVGESYVIIWDNYFNNNERNKATMVLSADMKFIINDIPAGHYFFTIASSPSEAPLQSGLEVKVHPKTTVWKRNATSTDWNEWSNWSNGSPWDCTNVIITKQSALYPNLIIGADNYCANIHFEPNTEVGNIHLLSYSGKAYIDMELTANNYLMLAAPLKSMVTGDMFIPAAMNGTHIGDYFTDINSTNAPENRFNPRIYQRMWNKTVHNRLIGGGDVAVTISEAQWTKPYNALGQPYALGDGNGFSLWVDNGNLTSSQTFVFKFPKTHNIYNYVTDLNQSAGVAQSIIRSKTGRFISENASNKTIMPLIVPLVNKSASELFIVGNPFMTHIDVAQFLAGNSGVIGGVKMYDGNTYNTVEQGTIAPMQSFLVVMKNGALTNASIQFTANMLTTNYGTTVHATTRSQTLNAQAGDLRIAATATSVTHTVLLRNQRGASNAYKPGEDSEILFDSNVKPIVSVFTIADSRALDVQIFESRNSIPIGIHVESPIVVRLKISGSGSYWNNWILKDKLRNVTYSMEQLSVGVNVGMVSTSIDRFELIKQ